MNRELTIRKVLIVDDEPDLRDILAEMMNKLGLECAMAENGRVALEMLKSGEFHLVLCDIMMPEMSGLACLEQAQIEGIYTPFVFVTGYGDSSRILQAVRLGAVDFVEKPFDRNEISEVVFRVLEIGVRRNQMLKDMKDTSYNLYSRHKHEEKVISMMRAQNNRKRTAK